MRCFANAAACAAAAVILLASVANAPAVTITASATPNVISAGEVAHIDLGVSGWTFDPSFYYQGFYWAAQPWVTDVTFYDGLGGSIHLPSSSLVGMPATHWTELVTYADAGTFSPHFEALIIDRLTRPGDCGPEHFMFCVATVDLGGNFSTSVTVNSPFAVPSPIVGAGLPGLLLAACGLLFTYRRRSMRLACI